MERERIDACRRALMNVQAGPAEVETVETLRQGLGDLTNIVLALLDDVDAAESKAERRAAVEGTDDSMKPLIITNVPGAKEVHRGTVFELSQVRDRLFMAYGERCARARVVIVVTDHGDTLVLKNNLGPRDEACDTIRWGDGA